jgi:hypothetical protein
LVPEQKVRKTKRVKCQLKFASSGPNGKMFCHVLLMSMNVPVSLLQVPR